MSPTRRPAPDPRASAPRASAPRSSHPRPRAPQAADGRPAAGRATPRTGSRPTTSSRTGSRRTSPRTARERAAERARRRRRRLLPLLAVLVLLSGYLVLDARDVVPGVLTTSEPWPSAEPFPEVSLAEMPQAPAAAAGFDAEAPLPSTESLAAITAALLDDERAGPDPSVTIADVATGELLLNEAGGTGRAPASVLKVLTGVAALHAMGPEHVFTTQVVDDGAGGLVLVGGGDIALAADAGDPGAVRGYAGLGDLADQVAANLEERGVTEIALSVDDSLFTGPTMAPNWDDVDVAGGWAMPITPIAVDLGRQQGINARQADPAIDTLGVFAERLTERGVEVDLGGRASATGEEVFGAVRSAPLGQIVAYNLQYSDNPLAEVLGRMTAVSTGHEPSFEGAGQAVLAVLEDLGVSVEGVSLVDTSGLSSLSRVTAQSLTETVLVAAAQPRLGEAIRGLPVGGLEGTLANRMNGTQAAGLVAAKTGTLPQVVSLSGLVHTVDGRLLAFAVMTGDFEAGGGYLARLAVDDWASRIAACGC